MPGTGPAPSANRRRRNAPVRGDWQASPGIGWQHGEIPKPPTGLTPGSRRAWQAWMRAWFAAHWTPDDLPILSQIIRLFDKIERDVAGPTERSEFRQLADGYGITKKGQQDRRWAPPKPDDQPAAPGDRPAESPYSGLTVVPPVDKTA